MNLLSFLIGFLLGIFVGFIIFYVYLIYRAKKMMEQFGSLEKIMKELMKKQK